MKRGKCYIGTSGWCYAHWAKGRFYPKGLKQGDWLGFFAQHFDTVEINSSFYRLPKLEMFTRWRNLTGSRFRFAVKIWQRITHHKRLANCTREIKDFLAAASHLGPQRGPLLVQLAPTMHKDVGRLDAFLSELTNNMGRSPWRIAVEFRNTDWLCQLVYKLLDGHGAALCLADMSSCPITEANNVDFIYIRRHGPGGRYRGCYPADHIHADAEKLCQWLDAGKDVYVYYNNDVEGYAIDNARQLNEIISNK
ncbi:MAG: DUF72 domain-containing protein [Planctomycetota bacterium]|jgi:uncharacterized protein YecE (DUF72 family)